MNFHESDEDLSAYLDDELAPSERARVQAHLEICDECSARREVFGRAMQALSALPEVTPTTDESRAIRLAVIEARARPRTWRIVAALAGATAVIAAVGGAILLGSEETDTTTAASERTLEAAAASELDFAENSEVNGMVASLAEVKSGTGRFKVSDVGAEQSQALEAYAREEAAPASSDQSSAGAEPKAAPSATTTGVALEDCLKATLRSQPYPMMPLTARPARYKGTPSWLLVYAWTRSTEATASLDRIQIWLFDRRAAICSAENFLYYYAS